MSGRLTANRQWMSKAIKKLQFKKKKKCHLIIHLQISFLVIQVSHQTLKWKKWRNWTFCTVSCSLVAWKHKSSGGFHLQELRCHSVARQMVGKICPSDGYAMKSDSQRVVQGLMLVPQYKDPLCCCAVVLTITLRWCAPTGRQSVYPLPHGMKLAFRSPWSSPLRLHPNTTVAVQI